MASTIPLTKQQWLDQLPEPYRTQAMEAVLVLPSPRNDLNGVFNSTNVHDAILEMFLFRDTKQGVKYWLDFCYKLHDQLITYGAKPKDNGETSKRVA